jgi:hypothetical protein
MIRVFRPESAAVRQFRESMQMDYWKWHDGVSYDLEALREASAADQKEIEAMLLDRGAQDWRDIEALATLDTPGARVALRRVLYASADHAVRVAVLEYAPNLVTDEERIQVLVSAIDRAEIGCGLAEALRVVRRFHPPKVMDALRRAARERTHSRLFEGALARAMQGAQGD